MSKFVNDKPRVIGRWTAAKLDKPERDLEEIGRGLEATKANADTAIAIVETFTAAPASNSAAASSSDPVSTEETERSAVAKAKKDRFKKAPWVKKAWSPTMDMGRTEEPYPDIPDSVRATEQEYLRRLSAKAPVLVYGKLYTNKLHERADIPAVIEDGTFGYMTPDGEYVADLHSFELIWYFRRDYPLSGKVNYAEYIRKHQTFHCLQFLYLDGETRHSIHRLVHQMLDETRSSTAATAVIASNSSSSRAPPGLSRPPPGLSRPPPGLSRPESKIRPQTGPLHHSGV